MKSYLLLILCSSTLLAYGQQNVTFEPKNFKNNPNGYEQAVDSINKGREYYKMGPSKYYKALPYYLSAEKFNPNNDQLNYLIGLCMLGHNSAFKTQALPYFQKAYELNHKVTADIHYQLGRAYHLNMKWDSAKQEYNTYLSSLLNDKENTSDNADKIADTKKKIEECGNGETLVQHPISVFIDNMGPTINTTYSEHSPVISSAESELIFTSKRPVTIEENDEDGKTYESLFISYFKNGAWTPAVNIGSAINEPGIDIATAGISNDGETLYIYRGDNGGDIYESHMQGSDWSDPEPMSSAINTKYKETSVTVSPDGKTLYFVSDKPGGQGGKDIYKSVADAHGRWREATNLGPVINTQYDEEGVFMAADGKTLYFSSQGHNTMGGFDIFKSVYDSGHWSVPENLGYPINTPDDDVSFSLSPDGKHGYYSSVRKEGYGDYDLYMITFHTEKPLVQSNEDSLIVPYKNAVASSPKKSDSVVAPEKTISDPPAKGVRYVMHSVFFEADKTTLSSDDNAELDKLSQLLVANKSLRIEIAGYTDNIGSDTFNQRLSLARAKSVGNYLIQHGVAAKRLIYKGYGRENPIATNTTEEGRQKNRRTEFKIIGKQE